MGPLWARVYIASFAENSGCDCYPAHCLVWSWLARVSNYSTFETQCSLPDQTVQTLHFLHAVAFFCVLHGCSHHEECPKTLLVDNIMFWPKLEIVIMKLPYQPTNFLMWPPLSHLTFCIILPHFYRMGPQVSRSQQDQILVQTNQTARSTGAGLRNSWWTAQLALCLSNIL